MLRLWPKRVHIGLFADACWIKSGRSPAVCLPMQLGQGAAGLIAGLQALIAHEGGPWRRGSVVTMTVSDSAASTVLLPWQPTLNEDAELHAFAVAVFQQSGLALDKESVLHAEYARYGAPGIAYAFPHSWLKQVEQCLAEAGGVLERIMSVTARAFFQPSLVRRKGPHLLFLCEAHRLGVLLCGPQGVSAIDYEPVVGKVHDCGLRLMRRLAADHPAAESITVWQSSAPEAAERFGFIEASLREPAPLRLPFDVWGTLT